MLIHDGHFISRFPIRVNSSQIHIELDAEAMSVCVNDDGTCRCLSQSTCSVSPEGEPQASEARAPRNTCLLRCAWQGGGCRGKTFLSSGLLMVSGASVGFHSICDSIPLLPVAAVHRLFLV